MEAAADGGEGEADAVAVGERRRGMQLERGQREAAEDGAELRGLAFELRGVGEVLQLASTAEAEVRAGRSGLLRLGRGCGGLERVVQILVLEL